MKYLLLVCWDVEKMNAQTEPDPDEPREEKGSRGSTISGLAASG
jgi:hypothetical protein